MYLEFYGLRETPFSLTPDPEYFFVSAGHKQALSYLSYGILQRKGFLQLTGEVGSGKTMIIRRLLEELGDVAVTAYVLNPADNFAGLLRFILKDLEVPLPDIADLSKTEMLDALYQFLLDRRSEGVPVILIFDEAQDLSAPVLEEIRLISNFETTKEKLIQIMFVGQPEFQDIIASPDLRQLSQRIAIRYHLQALSGPEMGAYVDHRLRVAGGDRIHFTSMAKDVMYSYTGGVPRLVNILGDYALLVGFVNETFVLNHRLLNEAIVELEGRAAPADADRDDPRWLERMRTQRRRQRGRRIRRARRVVTAPAVADAESETPVRTEMTVEDAPAAGAVAPVAATAIRTDVADMPCASDAGMATMLIASPGAEPVANEGPAETAPALRPVLTADCQAPPTAEAPTVSLRSMDFAPAEPAPVAEADVAERDPALEGDAAEVDRGTLGAGVDTDPVPSLGEMLRTTPGSSARPAGPPEGPQARQRRVLSPEEAGSLAAQALERGRQQGGPSSVLAAPIPPEPETGETGTAAAVVGDLPENWWQFAQADDTTPGAERGVWAALRRWWRALFGGDR